MKVITNGFGNTLFASSNLQETKRLLEVAVSIRVDLERAQLCGADLRDAVLKDGKFRGANFCGADLRGADLSFADVRGASFVGAKMMAENSKVFV
jgi:uncharacterized protein YjbI with pentapeptide repeats